MTDTEEDLVVKINKILESVMKKDFERYEHHGVKVWVDSNLKGQHREHNLCFNCDKFKPEADDHCQKAYDLFHFCKINYMSTPVFECADFKEDEPNVE